MRLSDPAVRAALWAVPVVTLVAAAGVALALAGRPAGEPVTLDVLGPILLAAAGLWLALAAVLAAVAWAAGPAVSGRVGALGQRLALADGADVEALVRKAEPDLGPLAEAFAPLAVRVARLSAESADLRGHVAALYQINPHFVLLCTLDGALVEANPAFYAITGLPPEAIRGGRAEALADIFPLGPLLELAQRSLAEGAALAGIDYALVDRDDEPRPVEVSMRALRHAGRSLVVIQATDVAARRKLERRVEAFSDTLDLMVDQRVAQLTAGQQALRHVLDAAGVAVASFDAVGGTVRWSGAARVLTGRAIADVPHFAAVAAALGLPDGERAAFTAWFWNAGDDGFAADHGLPGGVRRMIWRKVDADVPGRVDARSLVGVEAAPAASFAGDGLAGATPQPA